MTEGITTYSYFEREVRKIQSKEKGTEHGKTKSAGRNHHLT